MRHRHKLVYLNAVGWSAVLAAGVVAGALRLPWVPAWIATIVGLTIAASTRAAFSIATYRHVQVELAVCATAEDALELTQRLREGGVHSWTRPTDEDDEDSHSVYVEQRHRRRARRISG